MISKKIIPALLVTAVLAASVSTSASAHDRGGNGLAIAAGIIGAVAVGSMIANANAGPNYAPQPVYQQAPQPVYYQQAPQQVYYQPAPVYVRPAPVYVEREYRERPVYREYRREYRDVYYSR